MSYANLQNGVSISAIRNSMQVVTTSMAENYSIPFTTPCSAAASTSLTTMANNRPPLVSSRLPHPCNSTTSNTPHNTDSVIRQLDVEIADLKRLSTLSSQQVTRLKKLRFARETVVRAALTSGRNQPGISRPWLPASTATTTIHPRPPPNISQTVVSRPSHILW